MASSTTDPIRAAFERFDTNGNGSLDMSELEAAMRETGYLKGPRVEWRRKYLRETLHKLQYQYCAQRDALLRFYARHEPSRDSTAEVHAVLDSAVKKPGYPNATQPTVSRPFCARFAPFFRRCFALSGFLAPRRRERAKNGGKWAKFGGETGEKQRWLSGVGDRAAMAPKNWGKLCASLRQRYGSGPSGIAMGEVELRFFVEIWEHVTGERFEDAVAISRAESLRMLGQVRTSPPV